MVGRFLNVARWLIGFALILWVAAGSSLPAVASDPAEAMQVAQEAPGFQASMAYEGFGKGEVVNTFSGGLTVTHASAIALPQNLGATLVPTRVYNNKDLNELLSYACRNHADDLSYGWLGLGWTLSFGRVFVRLVDIHNGEENHYFKQYFFQDESGGEHRLYLNADNPSGGLDPWAPPDPVPPGTKYLTEPKSAYWYFTNDGSYIRARYGAGLWTLYYPDGSIRIAGGGNATVLARIHAVGVGPVWEVKNPYSNGWYVSSIKDRAGNTTLITYRPCDPANSQPFGGSIETIQDPFNMPARKLYFLVHDGSQGEELWKHGLLKKICQGSPTSPSRQESYEYDEDRVNRWRAGFPEPDLVPCLARVTDPVGLQTAYAYREFDADDLVPPTTIGAALWRIDYPTGGTSTYEYDDWMYLYHANCRVVACDQGNRSGIMWGVKSRTEHLRRVNAGGGLDNTAVWTWDRNFSETEGCVGLEDQDLQLAVVPVVVRDPLGREIVHFYSCSLSGQSFPPGMELAVANYPIGYHYGGGGMLGSTVGKTLNWYSFNGGDAANCIEETTLGSPIHPRGNARVRKSQEYEFLIPSGIQASVKTTQNYAWDKYGHWMFQAVSGTGLPAGAYQVTAQQYDLKIGDGQNPYQLDRLKYAYSGLASSVYIPTEALPPGGGGDDDPQDPNIQVTASGPGFDLKAVKYEYDDTSFPKAGLLKSKAQIRSRVAGFSVYSSALTVTPVNPGSYDPTATLTYLPGDRGNISAVAYTKGQPYPGGTPSRTYAAQFVWAYGMVSRMQWSPFSYPEFERDIDAGTGRIKSQTPNGCAALKTQYFYDGIGRLVEILPPAGEDPTRVSYPDEDRTRAVAGGSGITWKIGNTIRFYKGDSDAVPEVDPPSPLTGEDDSLYTVYRFDDLGRLWRTDTLQGDQSWSSQEKAYDPFGAEVFVSEAFTPTAATVRNEYTFPLASGMGSFKICPPKNAAAGFGGALGAWSSMFTTASYANPFTGTPDPFGRVRWSIRADKSRVRTDYNSGSQGLKTAIRLYDLNKAPGTDGENYPSSITTYQRDILGRLLDVTPPAAGARAHYDYDGFGNIRQVQLFTQTGTPVTQTRTFAYDALGHLTGMTQPEIGSWTEYRYDALGNPIAYKDAFPKAFEQTFDAKSRLLKVTQGGVTLAEHSYDGAGYAGGDYPLGRLTQSLSRAPYYTLDASNNPVARPASTTDFMVCKQYEYSHPSGLASKEITKVTLSSGDLYQFALSFAYQSGTNLLSSVTLPDGSTQDFAYTHGMATGAGFGSDCREVQGIAYGPGGFLKQMDFGVSGQSGTQYRYAVASDFRNRVGQIDFRTPGASPLWSTGAYAYDGVGNIRYSGGDSFAYDALCRLTSATVKNRLGMNFTDPVAYKTFGYLYDAFGNLTSRAEANPSQGDDAALIAYNKEATFTLTAGTGLDVATNRVKGLTRGVGAAPRSETFSGFDYDKDGRMIKDSQFQYDYEPLGKLYATRQAAGSPAKLVDQSLYDTSGERAVRLTYGANGALTGKVFSIRMGPSLVWEKTIPASGPETFKSYLRLGSRPAVTQITSGATTVRNYLVTDHLGTVRAVYEPGGVVKAVKDYEPFGVELYDTATMQPQSQSGNRLEFTGHERDERLGGFDADYMHFRAYAPSLARFTRPDNVMGDPLNPQSWNLYAYVKGNPVNFNDPTGHWPMVGHEYLINRSFPGLSVKQRAILMKASAHVDRVSNHKIENAHDHHEAKFGEKRAEAKLAIENEVKALLGKAFRQQQKQPEHCSDIKDDAFFTFGIAGHIVADGEAPQHVDEKGLPRTSYGTPDPGNLLFFSFQFGDLLRHLLQESPMPTLQQEERIIQKLRAAFKYTFGEKAYEEAIAEPNDSMSPDEAIAEPNDSMSPRE